jgi:hypothetical protein
MVFMKVPGSSVGRGSCEIATFVGTGGVGVAAGAGTDAGLVPPAGAGSGRAGDAGFCSVDGGAGWLGPDGGAAGALGGSCAAAIPATREAKAVAATTRKKRIVLRSMTISDEYG